jgi:uncharacterized protein (DUF1800 family)
LSRRRLLEACVAAAGGAALSGQAAAAQGTQVQLGAAADARRWDPLRMLVERTTHGVTTSALAEARALGYTGWLEQQLDPQGIDDTLAESLVATLPALELTGAELFQAFIMSGLGGEPAVTELRTANVMRAVHSRRQLFERMVEFWTDHFNIHAFGSRGVDILKLVDEREVVRAHALGTFPELLRASARSGAMKIYLDNYLNFVGHPNENYAREMLELHTMGVFGGFTESDVLEYARCLTGWTIHPEGHPLYGEHRFDANGHDDGAKVVLGLQIPPGGGEQDVEMVLDLVSMHPSTAQHISRKLASRLLVEDPPQVVVDDAAAVYLATGGDIREVLRSILQPANMRRARPDLAPKLRRPLHFVYALLRVTGPAITSYDGILEQLDVMGQLPYAWPAPNGYPDALGAWGGAVLPRWRFAALYFDDQIPGAALTDARVAALVAGAQSADLGRAVNRALTGGGLSLADEATLQGFVDQHPGPWLRTVRETLALAAAAPSFNLY